MCLVTDGWPAVRVGWGPIACLSTPPTNGSIQDSIVWVCVCVHEANTEYLCVAPGCFTFKQRTLATVKDLNAREIAS